MRASMIDNNWQQGNLVSGALATVETTVIRHTRPMLPSSPEAAGVKVQYDQVIGERGNATLRSCLIDRNHSHGVVAIGADATVEASIVRRTDSLTDQPLYSGLGYGAYAAHAPGFDQRGAMTVHSSVIDDDTGVAVAISGSDATIEGSLMRNTRAYAAEPSLGRGLQVQWDVASSSPGSAVVRASIVENNREVGVSALGAALTLEGSVVRNTLSNALNDKFGDGVVVELVQGAGGATVTGSRIEGNARAGIANFGAGIVVSATAIDCNAIDLAGETSLEGTPHAFTDSGGNSCGCAGATWTCRVLTSGLAAPSALPP
jgi:hypothetical protein